MKKFLYKSILFLGIIIAVVLLLLMFEGDRIETNEYMAALTDKHQRIENIEKPKIILAGGSNLVFGIDSKEIEKELKIPVVNLGLHAQLGLKFILRELKDVAKTGDIIILAVEHSMDVAGNLELQKMTAYHNSFAQKYLHDQELKWFHKYIIQLDNYHLLYKQVVSNIFDKAKNNQVYTRNGLNEYGDGMYHLDMPSASVLGSRNIIKNNKAKEIDILNDFHLFAEENNIRVLFSYGAYEISEYEKNKDALKQVHDAIKENLTFEVISELEDFVYPTSYFFDSVYHLNKTGRKTHTNKLISKIKTSQTFTRIP